MPESIRFIKPSELRVCIRALAMAEATLSDDPGCEFWADAATGAELAVMKDGAGNHAYFRFAKGGNLLLGFDHESPMSPHASATGKDDLRAWPGVYDSLPDKLAGQVQNKPWGESFNPAEVTFCLWNLGDGEEWHKGDIDYPQREYGSPDGQDYILGRVREYFDDFDETLAEDYRTEIDPSVVDKLWSGKNLTAADLRKLNPNCAVGEVQDRLAKMGVTVKGS